MITAVDFYFKEPLYKSFDYTSNDFEELFYLVYFSGKIDNYCPFCKRDSIFRALPRYAKSSKQSSFSSNDLSYFKIFSEEKNIGHFANEQFEIAFRCERSGEYSHDSHLCKFYLKFGTKDYTKTYFQKVGQFPSFSDLNDYKTKKYGKVLSDEKYGELNKGIGLASHGVGIGSFVYLRRIFEDLIFETYKVNKSVIEQNIEEKKFLSLKMNDKIEELKPFLPNFIYENRSLYGIMSKGVHQLTEAECLEKYKVVELGIRLILDDELVEFERKEMIEEFNKLRAKV